MGTPCDRAAANGQNGTDDPADAGPHPVAVASSTARFGLTSARNGLLAGIAIPVLIQAVGPRKARQLLMHGGIFDAATALRIGLVDELVDAGQVLPRALEWLGALLALPRAPMLLTRSLSRADLVDALAPDNLDLDRFVAGWYEADTQAGLRALLARLGK